MTVDPTMVTAIMAILGVGVIGIIQTIKVFLKAEGVGAYLIAFVVSFAATAFTLLQAGVFTIPALIIYGLIVFGEASGLYKVFNRS